MTNERYTLQLAEHFEKSYKPERDILRILEYGNPIGISVINVGCKKPVPTKANYYPTYSTSRVVTLPQTRKNINKVYIDLLETFAAKAGSSRPVLEHVYYDEVTDSAASSDGYKLAILDHANDAHGTTYQAGLNKINPKTKDTDGCFPAFDAIMPRDHKPVTMIASELIQAVQAALVFARDHADSVRFIYNGDNTLTVKGKSMERGDCETTITCDGIPQDYDVSLNGNYVLDILKHLGANDLVSISFSNTDANVLTVDTLPDLTMCIMPMAR